MEVQIRVIDHSQVVLNSFKIGINQIKKNNVILKHFREFFYIM